MVITTTPKKKDAQKICKLIIEKSLAACCQIIGPIESHYVWRNRVEVNKEYLCFIKTTKERYEELEKAIKKTHPYEVPEIIATDIYYGYKPYLNWIEESVKK
jgi:periplasmic divalent cation tolerance protein